MKSFPFQRRRSSAALASLVALAMTAAPSSVDAQSSLTHLPQGLTAWYVSADGSTVVGVEDTESGQFAFVLRDGQKTTLSLGGGFSFPTGVSGDGSTVVGSGQSPGAGVQAFVWHVGDANPSTFIEGNSSSTASGISADGSTIIGTEFTYTGAVGFVVRNGTKTNVTFGGPFTDLASVSADGSTVVGSALLPEGAFSEAFAWRVEGGAPTLVPFSDAMPSAATAVSADGSTVIGWKLLGSNVPAFVWRMGSETPAFIDLGVGQTVANSVSEDGSTVVGEGQIDFNNFRGFVWNDGATQVLEPSAGRQYSSATLVSADGSRFVGVAWNDPTDTLDYDSMDVVVWDENAGPVLLKDMLAADGVTPGPERLRAPAGMSADGTVIAGDSLLRTSSGDGFVDQFRSFVTVLSSKEELTTEEMIEDLIDDVLELKLHKGLSNALLSKLEDALAAVAQDDDITAFASLTSFIDQVRAQRGKKIPTDAADELIDEAQAIIAKL